MVRPPAPVCRHGKGPAIAADRVPLAERGVVSRWGTHHSAGVIDGERIGLIAVDGGAIVPLAGRRELEPLQFPARGDRYLAPGGGIEAGQVEFAQAGGRIWRPGEVPNAIQRENPGAVVVVARPAGGRVRGRPGRIARRQLIDPEDQRVLPIAVVERMGRWMGWCHGLSGVETLASESETAAFARLFAAARHRPRQVRILDTGAAVPYGFHSPAAAGTAMIRWPGGR